MANQQNQQPPQQGQNQTDAGRRENFERNDRDQRQDQRSKEQDQTRQGQVKQDKLQSDR